MWISRQSLILDLILLLRIIFNLILILWKMR